jgi:hypothetical protein
MTGGRATPGGGRADRLRCSFCDKDQASVSKLIAGPGVYICNECVDLCNEIITEEAAPGPGQRTDSSDDELLASLARRQAVVQQAEAAVHEHVAIMRRRGISWTRIGETLGVSKQAAWERFSGED